MTIKQAVDTSGCIHPSLPVIGDCIVAVQFLRLLSYDKSDWYLSYMIWIWRKMTIPREFICHWFRGDISLLIGAFII
jgi:hypothetical protein